MSRRCPKCQTDNDDTSKFCSECAAPLSSFRDVGITKTIETPMDQFTRGTIFADRYEIIEVLGRGGMGLVLRVEDKKTKEEIALKLIKPEIASDRKTIDRFRNELTTARRIRHKNICGMYDLGEHDGTYYITMEYVSGEDLKSLIKRVGRLDSGKAIKITQQVCAGLSEAHSLGVIHRDLKPNNIMIDKDGNAKIMDFGIAMSSSAKGLTGEGMIIGTPEYMSPEQAESEEIDQRSDIYSLGIILYEMLTGRLPFEGDTPLSYAIKHKSEKPKNANEWNPQIPLDLNRLVMKCLEKDRQNRYKNSAEILVELDKIEKGSPTTDRKEPVSKGAKKLLIPALIFLAIIVTVFIMLLFLPRKKSISIPSDRASIAVLPFADLSSQKDQEYFCDGMTDEIIAKLSTLEGLKVISRASVMQYKNTDIDIKQIGQDLGVKTILDGSVRKEKDDIRVTVQLVNAEDRFQIWTDTYDQKLERIFDIQSDIAENIVTSLRTELSPEAGARIKKRPTENLEAYRLYLQGGYFLSKTTIEGTNKAIEYFEESVRLDPEFAMAYARLANAYNTLGGYEFQRPRVVYPKARTAALKALEIDEEIAEAHEALAWINFRFELDWDGAEEEYKRGIELNANSRGIHSSYSMFLLHMGRFGEAIALSKRAIELDPLSLSGKTQLGFAYFVASRYDEAIETLKAVLEMNPSYPWANSVLGEVYERNGRYAEAITSYRKAIGYYGGSPSLFVGFLGHVYGKDGQTEEAKKILTELQDLSRQQYVSPFALAIIHLGMDQKDQAFALFQQALEERSTQMSFLKYEFRFDPVRSDPRFIALLKKANLD